jgi:hypothetical protein
VSLRRVLQNAALVVATLFVMFIVAEVSVRVLWPDRQLKYEVDEDLLFRFAPNQHGLQGTGRYAVLADINELGLREQPMQEIPKRRVLFLGDSFTFGSALHNDANFVRVVDQALADGTAAVNGGQPGYGIYQMEILLNRIGPTVRPDAVVLVIWQGLLLRQPLPPEEKSALLRKSRLIKLMKTVSMSATQAYRLFERAATRVGATSLLVTLGHHEQAGSDIRAAYDRALEVDLERLRRINKRARELGAEFALLFWPREGYAEPRQAGLSRHVAQRLATFTRDVGVPFLTLEQAFEPYTKQQLMLAGDGHPTAFGHCVAAVEILKLLQGMGWRTDALPDCLGTLRRN